MRTAKPLFIALCMAFNAGTALPSVAATPIVSRTDSLVSGRVLNAAGNPIPDAIVSIVAPGTTSALTNARTDANGNYAVLLPSLNGQYAIRVISIGFSPVTVTLTQQNGAYVVPPTIRMRPIAMALAAR